MSTDNPFRGKIVAVSLKTAVQGVWLQEAEVRRLGGREFVVGRMPDPGPNADRLTALSPLIGKVYWVPLDDVTQLIEFDTLEAAWASYARGGPSVVKQQTESPR